MRHSSGKNSLLVFKSYDQRRESFQGTEQDVIWLDEEPPLDIYTECLMRTMTTEGLVMLTFTPLSGLSEVVLSFLPEGDLTKPAKFTVFCTWDEVPHLSQEAKDGLWRSIPPFQRDARSKGVPSLGAGAIYPVPEADIVGPDFAIPAHWPRAYGLESRGTARRPCGARWIGTRTCSTSTRNTTWARAEPSGPCHSDPGARRVDPRRH